MSGVYERLNAYRLQAARAKQQPAFSIFSNKALDLICEAAPFTDTRQLTRIKGLGPAKISEHGAAIVTICSSAAGHKHPAPATSSSSVKRVRVPSTMVKGSAGSGARSPPRIDVVFQRPAELGMTLMEADQGDSTDHVIRVHSVEPYSQAATAGVHAGWVLDEVDSTSVKPLGFDGAMALLCSGKRPLMLTFKRSDVLCQRLRSGQQLHIQESSPPMPMVASPPVNSEDAEVGGSHTFSAAKRLRLAAAPVVLPDRSKQAHAGGHASSAYVAGTRCLCGKQAIERVSKSERNPNRPFFVCPLATFCDGQFRGGCKYFKWVDEAIKWVDEANIVTRDISISCTTQRSDDAVITQAEHDGTPALLHAVDWSKIQNTNRTNVIPDGEKFCLSFIMGRRMFQKSLEPAACSMLYPILERALRGLVATAEPSFEFTNITVNKNLQCKPHRDTGNIGDSLIIGFGEYTGGELAVADGTGQKRPPSSFRCYVSAFLLCAARPAGLTNCRNFDW
jgi:hypothetical protein